MIRILIADDHGLVRQGLKQLLSLMNDMSVVAEAANGDQVLSTIQKVALDLVLLDMTMPGLSGSGLIERIVDCKPELPVLVLSMHNEPSIAKQALKSGAMGYLTKDCDPVLLLAGIRKVAAGGRYIDPALAELIVFDDGTSATVEKHQKLSEREMQIFKHLARGFSNVEIASALSISNKTVSTYKARLMEKMGFSSTAELIKYAITNRLA